MRAVRTGHVLCLPDLKAAIRVGESPSHNGVRYHVSTVESLADATLDPDIRTPGVRRAILAATGLRHDQLARVRATEVRTVTADPDSALGALEQSSGVKP